MSNPNPNSCILTNCNLFQPNAQVSTCSPNSVAMCKLVEMSHPGLNEEISPYFFRKLKDPPSFTDFVDDYSKDFLEYLDLIWSLIGDIPQEEDGNSLPLVCT